MSTEKKQEQEKVELPTTPILTPKNCTTFNEDVVEIKSSDSSSPSIGLVTRCWADEQNPEQILEAQKLGIDFKPLLPGFLECLFPDGTRKQVLEKDIKILDRGFLRGDLVRPARKEKNTPPPSKLKPQAGIILELYSQVQLQRVLANEGKEEEELKEKWFDTEEFVANARLNRGDHVIFKDWVGLIEEVFEMAVLETENGDFRRVCDVGTNLSVGPANESIQQMLMERTGGFLSNFLGTSQRVKTILDIKQLSIAVNWLCRNPSSTSSTEGEGEGDGDGWKRPKRYWTEDLDQLKLVRATADHLRTINDKLVPRDLTKMNLLHPPPKSLISKKPWSSMFFESLSIFSVQNSKTHLKILWQDGTISERVPSFEFEQVHVVDDLELETFPGDLGLLSLEGGASNGNGKGRCGIVQSMDSRKRTIRLKYLDNTEEEEEIVSVLEFDPHGPPQHEYGVRRGDYILIKPETPTEEEDNGGVELPEIQSLGESETRIGLMPSGEQLRLELSSFGLIYAQSLTDSFKPSKPQTLPLELSSIRWYGEVWDLLLNGNVLVRFPDGEKFEISIKRIVRLEDGMLDPHSEMMMMMNDHDHDDDDAQMEDVDGEEEEGWTTEEEEETKEEVVIETNSNSRKRKRSRRESRGWADDEEEEDQIEEKKTTNNPTETSTVQEKEITPPDESENWQRFEILEQVPLDHHYCDESTPEVASKNFISRVRKEYKVLSSSLPPNILVRGYESRLDLLRCLIIGPLGTPFQNSPFLFDLYLNPQKFPLEPPQVYFHSWSTGATRVSPNLYAEGKVCLSLLGTWSGDKTESWSSARSSILQILISIQGLIMVENPYFTEPGFEKQIGTPEGNTASQLYNERSLVLTRNFIKRGLEFPPSGLEKEINHYYYYYYSEGEPRLKGIVEQCRELLKESDQYLSASSESEEEPGQREREQSKVVTSLKILSEGGALSLRRTLKGLEELLVRGPRK
ncbi:hypothetical protein JCM3765_000500 [Sporobolomyces pararoseus]